MSRVLVAIPARFGSSRFPGKALADLDGRPLVVRTAERASAMRSADEVLVATDDDRIREAVVAAGFDCAMTGEHASGTDRIGEAVAGRDADIVINLQGDEPLFDPADGDRLAAALDEDPDCDIATLGSPFTGPDDWRDPNAVKALTDVRGRALCFSRSPVPGVFPGREAEPWRLALHHVGVYAYRREALQRFLALPPDPVELCEGLEQLRGLRAGLVYRVLETAVRAPGVDTPEDLERVRALWRD